MGYVGRLESHKGVTVLLEAVAELPDVELEIVGDGPERESIVSTIRDLAIADRVSVRGYASQSALPELYRSFDVVVVPSLETASWIEQFGRVAVEAMAAAVPVVASDSGSLPEVLGGAGLLVPPGNVAALAEALGRLRDDRALRTRLAGASHRRAATYSWSAVAGRQHDLYEEMVG